MYTTTILNVFRYMIAKNSYAFQVLSTSCLVYPYLFISEPDLLNLVQPTSPRGEVGYRTTYIFGYRTTYINTVQPIFSEQDLLNLVQTSEKYAE